MSAMGRSEADDETRLMKHSEILPSGLHSTSCMWEFYIKSIYKG